jgi:hypothetical protein
MKLDILTYLYCYLSLLRPLCFIVLHFFVVVELYLTKNVS